MVKSVENKNRKIWKIDTGINLLNKIIWFDFNFVKVSLTKNLNTYVTFTINWNRQVEGERKLKFFFILIACSKLIFFPFVFGRAFFIISIWKKEKKKKEREIPLMWEWRRLKYNNSSFFSVFSFWFLRSSVEIIHSNDVNKENENANR